jgi:tight adherence protein C
MVLPLYVYLSTSIMGPPGGILAVVFTVLTGYLLRRRLAGKARYRLLLIKRRLPFLLDLLTLLMEAGSTFLQSLKEAVDEFRDHPVGMEFGRVLAELSMGKTRTEALESMRERLADDEITSIVGSIIQGEQLGTPLALLFRTQADVLRIKRTQRAETVAGEAGVKMLLPAVLVMAATVIIILGPFVLSFIYADFIS